ncbi:HORMA domain-containing protein 1 [Acipenser ruthenus]|uniref:HORMA domain-containing protein 1 n=1 Tax=Acipenser ruthenus TaxID=7906 RepID=A0A444U9T6_ACIRT|nr:HORMA domain-containing protein 1 [Acipenser ruthenus]
MQNLDTLPNDVSLTIKLYYYDDVTSTDYQPPGFKFGECDSLWFEGTAVHIKVGELKSAFHVVKVQVTADQEKMERMQRENALKEDIDNSEKKKGFRNKNKKSCIEITKQAI